MYPTYYDEMEKYEKAKAMFSDLKELFPDVPDEKVISIGRVRGVINSEESDFLRRYVV